MDSFASVPYRIRMMLGGIRMDKAPEKATMAPDIPWSYCLRSISGSDRRPTVAVPASACFRKPALLNRDW